MKSTKSKKKKYAHIFRAKIQKLPQTFYFVETPATVSRAVVKRTAPVLFRVNESSEYAATLMPRKNGRHVLFLRGEIRKDANVSLGDTVTVSFNVDSKTHERETETPEEVIEALRMEDLVDAFHSIPPGMRRQLLRWYRQAVHDSTREKRIQRLVELAHAAREKAADRAF